MAYIKTKDLWKSYPGVWPLKGVSFEVDQGRVVGVLGHEVWGPVVRSRSVTSYEYTVRCGASKLQT